MRWWTGTDQWLEARDLRRSDLLQCTSREGSQMKEPSGPSKHSRGTGEQPVHLSPKNYYKDSKGDFLFFALIGLNPEEERRD